ncbi:uncharacterized protein LOC135195916 [Macrobrachium nipponense]|uniref:uncharacterized protein LOC135195916 n=1 Tax=Macrobrachium nipponense TaxID=159736 RepID=UPI0030C7E0BB
MQFLRLQKLAQGVFKRNWDSTISQINMLLRPSTFVLVAVTLGLHMASAKRTCFTNLRLKTTSGFVEKEFEGFETRAFLGTCATVKKDLSWKAFRARQKQIWSPSEPNGWRDSHQYVQILRQGKSCRSDDPVVDVKYKASSCGNEGYMSIGRLCCFKCIFGPFTLFQPIDNCAPTARLLGVHKGSYLQSFIPAPFKEIVRL